MTGVCRLDLLDDLFEAPIQLSCAADPNRITRSGGLKDHLIHRSNRLTARTGILGWFLAVSHSEELLKDMIAFGALVIVKRHDEVVVFRCAAWESCK